MIRLKGLSFRSSQSGPQGRTLRQAPNSLYASHRAQGSGLSFLDEEVHHEILAGCEYQEQEVQEQEVQMQE